jgi:hypothetical protein
MPRAHAVATRSSKRATTHGSRAISSFRLTSLADSRAELAQVVCDVPVTENSPHVARESAEKGMIHHGSRRETLPEVLEM